MTLLIVNVCAFANQIEKLPQHVGAMSWHHAKFHDFQACFGFTGIKKPRFSIFPVQPRRPDVWISLPSLTWGLEIHPRTQMWFSNNFGALEHVLAVQIWIMHIKCLEIQLMYKKAKRTRNYSGFVWPFLYINLVFGHLMCIIKIWTTSICSSAPKLVEKSHVCPWVNF